MANSVLLKELSDVGLFMGRKSIDASRFLYHKNWDWLMKACSKFNSLNLLDREYESICDDIDHAVSLYEIMPVFKKLVRGVRWYNEHYPIINP